MGKGLVDEKTRAGHYVKGCHYNPSYAVRRLRKLVNPHLDCSSVYGNAMFTSGYSRGGHHAHIAVESEWQPRGDKNSCPARERLCSDCSDTILARLDVIKLEECF